MTCASATHVKFPKRCCRWPRMVFQQQQQSTNNQCIVASELVNRLIVMKSALAMNFSIFNSAPWFLGFILDLQFFCQSLLWHSLFTCTWFKPLFWKALVSTFLFFEFKSIISTGWPLGTSGCDTQRTAATAATETWQIDIPLYIKRQHCSLRNSVTLPVHMYTVQKYIFWMVLVFTCVFLGLSALSTLVDREAPVAAIHNVIL